jgi:hypothetical protein
VNGTTGLRSIHVRPGHPDFLELPWHLPLDRWAANTTRVVDMPRGLSRHEVVFLSYGHEIYAFKELSASGALREFDLLRALGERRLPAVEPVGHALTRADGGEGGDSSVLITRFLESSLPYRTLFMQQGLERYRDRLLDAIAGLLVRLHLAGVYWGDCSLSNTLFRRDAGELQAFLVDAETSEMHEHLSEGLRRQDLAIMEENIAGEIADVAAAVELPEGLGVRDTSDQIRERYERLWEEITREVAIHPGERFRIHEHIRTLNELGFSVSEVELIPSPDGNHLHMRTIVTDRDYHRHQLHNLTGIVAGDRQAALMLNEIREVRATLSSERQVLQRLAPLVKSGSDPPELYCQVLEHKWFMSERAQGDVGLGVAIEDYLATFRAD